ncbi:MAG: tyrosine-type recombinase/integrase [Aestuariibacter sp.]
MTKDKVQRYIAAATRDNTRKSYRSAIDHFEVHWGGLLPATSNQIALYLTEYADKLSASTLKQRLSALASWHSEQGFPDPTKAPVVKKVLKGIREVHPFTPKVSPGLPLKELEQTINWLDARISEHNTGASLASYRDKALLLVGFWRGFRSDELCRLDRDCTTILPEEGAVFYLHKSKGDRNTLGKEYKMPALSRLCPVTALTQWLELADINSGPIFRRINKWGKVADKAMAPGSILPLIRNILTKASINDAENYGSHSLRRGFANWATGNGWDLKTLMEYVGWRDVKTAMRYMDTTTPFSGSTLTIPNTAELSETPVTQPIPVRHLAIELSLLPFTKKVRNSHTVRSDIERLCFKPMGIINNQDQNYIWELREDDDFEEVIHDLIAAVHQQANEKKHMVELVVSDPVTAQTWD